jgi:hypothetical protein
VVFENRLYVPVPSAPAKKVHATPSMAVAPTWWRYRNWDSVAEWRSHLHTNFTIRSIYRSSAI